MINKKVLCLTHSSDSYVPELIESCLANLGLKMVRMNTDSYPLSIQLTAFQSNNRESGELTIDGITHQLNDFIAVYFRKNMQANLATELDGKLLRQATKEATEAKNAILYALESVFWIDFPFDIQRAENKQLQLHVAKNVGLTIPNSLLSNDPSNVEKFYHQEEGNIISKMLTPLTNFMQSASSFVYTSKVKKEHLSELASLRFCPMQFQQEIEKSYELRVIYVDGKCFTGKIATTAIIDENKPDWRRATSNDFFWQEYQLPKHVSEKINKLMNKLSLRFGALDLIKSTNDDYVFLEVNPCGEWGMLQQSLNLPIAENIAKCIYKNIIEGNQDAE
jgi:glutathione synthase/RimK-type ligase-like ATP-grasp enzyme